jgi:hypothetical protein
VAERYGDAVLRSMWRIATFEPEETWPAHVVAQLAEEIIRLRGTDTSWLAVHPENVLQGSRVKENIGRHHRVLNRLDPHLGCVVCRGPLTDGVCPTCDPQVSSGESDRG